jgi:type VI secretion system protein ImpC
LIDVSAEELAADLSGSEALEDSGLYKLLIEEPAQDAQQGPFSVIIANYTFARTRAQAELLGRLAKVASDAPAACLASINSKILEENPKDLDPEIVESWTALGALPEAGYLAMVTPDFMLRQPYGKKSEPVDCFEFEEITPKTGLTGFLWTNPSVLMGLLLAQTSVEQGKKMNPGSIATVGDLPFFYYTDKDGDQAALPCTEKLVTSREASLATSQGFIPVVSMKGSPEVRVGSFNAINGKPIAGPWAPLNIPRSAGAVATAPAAAPPPPAMGEQPAPPPAETPAPAAEAPPQETPPPAAEAAPAEAAAEAADSTGDPDLDALLAGLSTPAEGAPAEGAAAAPAAGAPPAAETQAGDLDPELADLLKGL